MRKLTLLAAVALLALLGVDRTTSLETCAPQKCQSCSQNVECHCPSSQQKHKAECRSSYVDYFDGRTGEAICAPVTRLWKHQECLKEDSRFSLDEARVKKVNGTMLCSDLMKHGCVQLPKSSATKIFKCWCESLGEVISMNKYGIHLSIYGGRTGELLCPLAPRPGDCTTCSCAKRFTAAPTLAPTTEKSALPVSSESTAPSDVEQTEAKSSAPTTSPPTPTSAEATSPAAILSDPPAPTTSGLVAPIVGAVALLLLLSAAAVALTVVVRRRRRGASKAAPVAMAECEAYCEENDLYGTL